MSMMTDEEKRVSHVKSAAVCKKASYWQYNLSLNRNTDADLIELLDNSDNKLKLIKDALRKYAAKSTKKKPTK